VANHEIPRMKFRDEYRDPTAVQRLSEAIAP
jgi:hypothetical protein